MIELVDERGADVIFCSTRTKGDTVRAVEEIGARGFEVLWTSTYETERDHDAVNELKARHLLELMCSMNLLPGELVRWLRQR